MPAAQGTQAGGTLVCHVPPAYVRYMAEAGPTPAAATAAPYRRESNVLVGAGWMLAAGVGFGMLIALIRFLADSGIHPFQVAFFRCFFGMFVLAPFFWRNGLRGGLRTQRLGLYTLRGATGALAMITWFWAIANLPITEATALSFTTPLMATILAILFLGEVVRFRRIAALLAGFVGVMVILRPGMETVQPAALVVLVSCLCMAMSTIFIKRLTDTEPPDAIVAYMLLMLMPIMLVASLFVWVWPTWEQLGWLLLMGVAATLAHMGLTRAFRAADVSTVLPFDFSRLIFVSIFAWFLFGEATSVYTWTGAAIITLAAVYIAHRERIAERERRRTARTSTARESV